MASPLAALQIMRQYALHEWYREIFGWQRFERFFPGRDALRTAELRNLADLLSQIARPLSHVHTFAARAVIR